MFIFILSNENLLKRIHSSTFCNSVLTNFCNSIHFALEIDKTVSSAKRVELNADAFGKSFTYRAKRKGPSDDPWGIPWLISRTDDL